MKEGKAMKKLLTIIFIISTTLYSQTYLNKNWLLINKDNSPLISNSINAFFEDKNNGYWISSVGPNGEGYLQYFRNGVWQTFDSTNSPLNKSIRILDIKQAPDGRMLFGTLNNGVYIKNNDNWDSLNTYNSQLPSNFIFDINIDRTGRWLLGTPNYGISIYDNGNWTFFNDNNSFNGIGNLSFIEVDSSNYIWIGTSLVGLFFYNGNQWVRALNGLLTGGPYQVFQSLVIDSDNKKWAAIHFPSIGPKIAVSISDTSFVYYDRNDWAFQFSFFTGHRSAIIDKNNIKYFGTSHGLLIYDNNGNWQFLNSPTPCIYFKNGLVDSKNNKVFYLLTSSSGQGCGLVFYNQDSVRLTSVENNSITINNFYLFQNYPNPFNSVTKIKFSIPHSELIQIKVYDLFGREIKTLLNEHKKSGTYEIEFDANNLPSGVYFYRMFGGKYSGTKKMILLK
jgi:hypothetical protein